MRTDEPEIVLPDNKACKQGKLIIITSQVGIRVILNACTCVYLFII